jgi:hypothetical protein
LESVYTGNRIVGSNPTPSATGIAFRLVPHLHGADDVLQVADARGRAINMARFEFRKMRCRC